MLIDEQREILDEYWELTSNPGTFACMSTQRISGRIVDVHRREMLAGTVVVEDGKIAAIEEHPVAEGAFILPGFVDAHVHIESSMMPPVSFARLAVQYGTVATVSDPHEIANVLGVPGVEYMLAMPDRCR